MPVQINEMIIRANIVEADTGDQAQKAAPGGDMDKEQIIKECVAKVMELLNRQTER